MRGFGSNRNTELRKLLDLFWHTIPPIWHATRTLTHTIATEEYGITPSKFHALRRIVDGHQSVSQLADCLHVSRPNVSRTVDELVNEGFVERLPDPEDRRGVKLLLTVKGQRLFDKLHEQINSQMVDFFAHLSDEELSEVISGLSTMQRLIDNQQYPGRHNETIT